MFYKIDTIDMLRKGLFSIIFAICSVAVYAQQKETLSFMEEQFDFGKIKESDGPVRHQFNFVNNSSQPVRVLNVTASCGCTTPDWTKDEVKPGETGYIQAEFNPSNRPGVFHKSLTVITTLDNAQKSLYIRGMVEANPKSIEEELPTKIGVLRLKYRSLNLGRVYTSDQPTVSSFSVYNDSDKPLAFMDKVVAPAHIKIEFTPKVIPPKTTGTIKLSYDAKAKDDYGFMSESVRFYTDENEHDAEKVISVYATVLEYFKPLTAAQMSAAPRLGLNKTTYDFGTIGSADKVSTTFTLTNTGKNALEIRKVKSNCSCLQASIDKETLQPGESVLLKATFFGEGRKGNQQKAITIYSNDPRASAQLIAIKAVVK